MQSSLTTSRRLSKEVLDVKLVTNWDVFSVRHPISIGLNSVDTGSSKSPKKLEDTFEMIAHNSVICSMSNV